MFPRAITAVFAAYLTASLVALAGEEVADTSADLDAALRRLKRAPSGVRAELALFDIAGQRETADPKVVIATLERALEISRLAPSSRERARRLLARAELATGDVDAAQQSFDRGGFITDWLVIGPFDNEGATGFGTAYGPERVGCDAVRMDQPIPGADGPVEWRPAPRVATRLGHLDLEALGEPDTGVCYYALTDLVASRGGQAVLRVGVAGAVRALWNDSEAIVDPAYRGADADRFAARVTVREGNNRLLVKVCSDESGHLGLYARLTDRDRDPWPLEPTVAPDPLPACAAATGREAGPKRLPQLLDLVSRAARSKTAKPRTKAEASRFMMHTHALHRASHEARDLARSACERSRRADHCLLWSELALDRNERRQAVTKALEAEPRSVPALLAAAEVERDGPDPNRARSLVARALEIDPTHLAARMLDIEILADQGLPMTALARAEELVAALPGIPGPIALARRLAEDAGAVARALELNDSVLESRFDDIETHQTLARAAAARGDRARFEHHAEAILILAGNDAGALHDIAELREGLGDLEPAEDLYRRAVSLAPNDASAHKQLGMFLLRNGRDDEGVNALGAAREIMPQDAWIADYLELRSPAARFEEPFVVPPEAFLAERGLLDSGEDARYLVDSTVIRVFDNGLASRFTQLVVEVGSRASARDWRQHAIQFAPSSQRVELIAARVHRADGTTEQATGRFVVAVAEPWYRLYYDLQAEIIELPPLEPGDVVELLYRVDDTAMSNVFADYFGDLSLVHGELSKQLWRYAIVFPADRELVLAAPAIDGLDHQREERDDVVVERLEVENVPRAVRELHMPGATAGVAYVHVSTYASWDDLGRWYQGLVRNQLLPDARIAEQVRELTEGLTTAEQKVAAIYDWVVTATRYVGLEFGIHGYKPYRAPLVAARGFGDCKDKASLLVTMLRQAGLEAELALVRTRSAGYIEDLPASLSVFNHAIAYVPGLDLWLDGTAEHHGTSELPFEDQGVIALRLSGSRVELVRTPVLPAEHSVRDERLTVLLDSDGEARITVKTEVSGATAPTLRSKLEAERMRRERFEALLVETFPGARLGELELESLDDLEAPVRYRYTAFVPAFGRAKGDDLEVGVDRGLRLSARYGKLRKREHSLIVGPARLLSRSMSIDIPSGYRIARLPAAAVIDSPFGRLELSVARVGDRIEVERTFRIDAHEIPVADYAEFTAFCQSVDEALGADIVLRRQR
jgi:transglutaminase-like putative cysteine protease